MQSAFRIKIAHQSCHTVGVADLGVENLPNVVFVGRFRDVTVVIGDIRNLQPVRPTAVADRGLYYSYFRSAGMDDLSVSDIDTDMPFVPYGKSWDFRYVPYSILPVSGLNQP